MCPPVEIERIELHCRSSLFCRRYVFILFSLAFDDNLLNATEARSKLYSLIDEAADTHQPVVITGKRCNAVLISEEDWNAISETLHLLSVPGMRKSIQEGLKQDLSESSKELDW